MLQRHNQIRKTDPGYCLSAGELSQPVTAAAILAEVAQGRLQLEEQIGSYYEDIVFAGTKFRPRGRISFTLSQLLSHSAGFYPWVSTGYPPAVNLPDLTQILRGEEPAGNFSSWRGFDPEAGVRYSDLIMSCCRSFWRIKPEKPARTGQPGHIFPLNLTRTFWNLPGTADLATGHSREGRRLKEAITATRKRPLAACGPILLIILNLSWRLLTVPGGKKTVSYRLSWPGKCCRLIPAIQDLVSGWRANGKNLKSI